MTNRRHEVAGLRSLAFVKSDSDSGILTVADGRHHDALAINAASRSRISQIKTIISKSSHVLYCYLVQGFTTAACTYKKYLRSQQHGYLVPFQIAP